MNGSPGDPLPVPIAVFLDTNILDALPETLESGELSAIVKQGWRVMVPDIAAREWIAHRFEKAQTSLIEGRDASRHLKQYSNDWMSVRLPKMYDLLRLVRRACAKRLRNAGLRVLSPPRLDQRDLIFRATMKVPPFADQGRGFKDEVLLLGILKHLGRWNYRSAVLVSKDRDFLRAAKERFDDLAISFIVVKTIAEAAILIDQGLNAAVKQETAALEQSAKEFAEEHWDSIKASVERSAQTEGLSEFILTGSAYGSGNLRRVLSITPQRIDHVRVGDRHAQTDRTLMTIFVECEVAAEVEHVNWLPRYLGGKLFVGREKASQEFPTPERITTKFKTTLTVEATARHIGDREWADLRIVHSAESSKSRGEMQNDASE